MNPLEAKAKIHAFFYAVKKAATEHGITHATLTAGIVVEGPDGEQGLAFDFTRKGDQHTCFTFARICAEMSDPLRSFTVPVSLPVPIVLSTDGKGKPS